MDATTLKSYLTTYQKNTIFNLTNKEYTMNKFMPIIAISLVLLFGGCNESSTAPDYIEPISSSSQVVITPTSSSSQIVIVQSSQSTTVTEPIIAQPTLALFIGEIGYVCNGFNINAVSNTRATEGYMAMHNICGDRATMTTGTQPRVASVINDWMINDLELHESLRIAIVNDVNAYGSTLRFYDAVDGYLRYIYIEPYGDGLGLMKKAI